ncbi:MAG: enoyl-CoA hydratase/isomerase family protein [Verrucomicrobia bacterium]|nr:enoyl-CoA hydratase/isomerase family protein [Verrucomicrobiota bacterium]MCH8511447.1 enoyl-CoA hydratase/isomerase family protein [Kiritimatiellia bacterium]
MIDYTLTDHIATITFNRPDQLNAMNRALMRELIDTLDRVNVDPEVRVVVLTGAGRAFMAGADIKEYATQTQSEFEAFQAMGRRVYDAIEGLNMPVIAAVNGHAFGGGFEIALACDLMVAAEGAKFGLPEILLHLIPGGGGTQRLPRKLGHTRANELLFTGRTVTAEELREWGLVNHIYPRDAFAEQTRAFAATLADKDPLALRTLKQLTRIASGPVNSAAQCLENEALARLYPAEPAQAKLREFLQKSLDREQSKRP